MDPKTSVKQEDMDHRMAGLTGSAMCFGATLMTSIEIAQRWPTYTLWDRALAIFFVLLLLVIPVTAVLKEKTWVRSLEAIGKANLAFAYSLVALATVVFGRR